MSLALLLYLASRKDSNLSILYCGRYTWRMKGKREEDGFSQLSLLTGHFASKKCKSHGVRRTAITWGGTGVSDPIPRDVCAFDMRPLLG